jgi:CDGSH-type Zn-finger protein
MPYEKNPWKGTLKPGTYAFCSCGESENKPFCDGSHARKGTGKSPYRTELPEERRYALCQCGHSGKAPFCDGTHKTIDSPY